MHFSGSVVNRASANLTFMTDSIPERKMKKFVIKISTAMPVTELNPYKKVLDAHLFLWTITDEIFFSARVKTTASSDLRYLI